MLDTVIMGNAPLWEALQEREKFYANASDWTDEDGMRVGELEGIVGDQGGYTAEADAAILLQGLDIPMKPCMSARCRNCKAARRCGCCWRRRCSAMPPCCCSTSRPTTWILDSVHWLQQYLLAYTGCLIVISHDRHFLNEICTHTADIDYQSIITYTGAYDDMVLAKTQIRARVEAGNAQREKKIEQLNEFIARFRGRYAILAGHFPQEGSGAAPDLRACEIQYSAPLYPLSERASLGTPSARNQGALEVVRRARP